VNFKLNAQTVHSWYCCA